MKRLRLSGYALRSGINFVQGFIFERVANLLVNIHASLFESVENDRSGGNDVGKQREHLVVCKKSLLRFPKFERMNNVERAVEFFVKGLWHVRVCYGIVSPCVEVLRFLPIGFAIKHPKRTSRERVKLHLERSFSFLGIGLRAGLGRPEQRTSLECVIIPPFLSYSISTKCGAIESEVMADLDFRRVSKQL